MKRTVSLAAFLLIAVSLFLVPVPADAGMPKPPLPPLIVPAPPPVILIPGTYAYFAPGLDDDLIFFHGYWYRPYGGGWYRSSNYSGPWGFVPGNRVPHAILHLPSGYRSVRGDHIPYGQLKKNWNTWEREKHWDKHEGKQGRKQEKRRKNHDGGRENRRGGSSEQGRGERGGGHGKAH